MLSIIYATCRGLFPLVDEASRHLGQYQLLAQCLQDQTFQDFELVVVDATNPLPRPELTWFLRDRVTFVRPRATPLRGRFPGAFAPASARNTALTLARGSTVVALDDCYSFGPEFLARIAALADRGLYAAPLIRRVNGEDQAAYRVADPTSLAGAFRSGLTSYPLAAALVLNGYDERFDGCHSYEDVDFNTRLRLAGVDLVHDEGIYVVDQRHVQRTDRSRPYHRCTRLTWALAQDRHARGEVSWGPWTTLEEVAWARCCPGCACPLSGGACDAPATDPAADAALRAQDGRFDLEHERAEVLR